MDYAVQLLAIMGLFLGGAYWLSENFGLPKIWVGLSVIPGMVVGLMILMKRTQEEYKADLRRQAEEQQERDAQIDFNDNSDDK